MVSLGEIATFAGVLGTFLGADLAVAAHLNGKHIKSAQSHLEALLKQMRESDELRHREVMAELKASREEWREWMKATKEEWERMDARAQARHQELMAR